jgi:squalene-hopene/tetraprenyl-beta-curcumene cyclase
MTVALLLAVPLQQPDTKDVADALVRRLRATQPADLSWGESLQDACHALDALARSPRAYTDLDGPFFRVPAQRIAQAAPGSLDDALVVLALGQCLNGELAQARDAALQRLLAGPPRRDYEALLALRTYPPPDVAWPAPQPGDEPGVAVLIAADPAGVPAPPVTDVAAWTRWARAARLRGVVPHELPPLPDPGPDAGFHELLAAVQTVSAMHSAEAGEEDEGAPFAAPRGAPALVPPGQDLAAALERAWGFLESHQHGGTFGLGLPGADEPEPGITAMCLTSAVWVAEQTHRPRPAWIDEGLDFLVSLQRPDGSIQMHGLDVYTTSVSIEALVAAGREKDRAAVARARDFLVATQSDEGEGYDKAKDVFYGGTGYGDGERPDLSNTQMAVQAVVLAGTSREDPFFSKTRVFLDKCQNFGERQELTFPHPGGGTIVSGNDGGGTYFPGNSEAGEIDLGGGRWQPRSYGSMSYALAKSWVLCGTGPDDPRVAAVVRWLARNFSVDENPGFATPSECKQGLYYYRLVMARTLALLPEGSFKDEHGQPIDWRTPLVRRLLDSQRVDGSWINTESLRWWEGAPPLASAYALLALRAAQR